MDRQPTLSQEALTGLMQISHQPRASIHHDYLITLSDHASLLQHDLLSPKMGECGTIYVDDEDKEVIWDSDSRRYRYFDIGAGWVDLPEEALKSYCINFTNTLSLIAQWLDITRTASPRELEANLLWELGETWIGRRRIAILFLRCAGSPETVTRIRAAISRYPNRSSCLILTDERLSEHAAEIPGNPIVVALLELFSPSQAMIQNIDTERLASLLGAMPKAEKSWLPVECSEDGSYLRLHDEEYHFTGYTHKRIVRLLYLAWERGEPRQRTAMVLEEAESGSRTISQAFSGCKTSWKVAIGYGSGFCWLNIDHQ